VSCLLCLLFVCILSLITWQAKNQFPYLKERSGRMASHMLLFFGLLFSALVNKECKYLYMAEGKVLCCNHWTELLTVKPMQGTVLALALGTGGWQTLSRAWCLWVERTKQASSWLNSCQWSLLVKESQKSEHHGRLGLTTKANSEAPDAAEIEDKEFGLKTLSFSLFVTE